ncbi:Borrelia lipoprotein-containing protein (plasmid) [Borrelia crocidurae str. Achema]|uniref:Variable large protein n=1 Tax=Borrelia crocidurae (strain Achema) TaxID=1155096 RepID=I0FDU6_BORCA|nr:Borrelia lipoprotein-containing protein [Borrelia crocidurae str. Achema]
MVMMMVVMMVMGCNSGGVKGEGTVGGGDGRGLSGAMMEVGRSAENAFYAFLELVSDVLGFKVNKDAKKEDVGKYFNSLVEKIGVASEELEKVAKKATTGVDKNDISKNPIKVAVDTAKGVLGKLEEYLESLKEIGDSEKVGVAVSQNKGVAANTEELKKAYKALKGIVDTAVKEGVTNLKAGNMAVKVDSADNKDGIKILATDQGPGVAVGEKAAAILSIVNGEEMLASIVASGENDQALGGNDADASTSTLRFALGGNKDNLAKEAAKAAAVAGGDSPTFISKRW